MSSSTQTTPNRFPLTKRSDGRWCKKFRGKTHYFRGTADQALAQWQALRNSLTTAVSGHGSTASGVRQVAVKSIRPAPENDAIYGPIDRSSAEFLDLVKSIRRDGVLVELVLTDDGYVLSGNTRLAAAIAAGLRTVPCRILPIRREDDIDAFVRLLVSYNKQRNKTAAHKFHEAVVEVNEADAWTELTAFRAERSRVDVVPMVLGARKPRSSISAVKRPMLNAILDILDKFAGTLSDRKIHYLLLNDPPLKNADDRKSKYKNDKDSYKNLTDLLIRARLEGHISWERISDETRPVVTFNRHREIRGFIDQELTYFLQGYERDLLQSQPHYVEVLAEKNTVAGEIRPVCDIYGVPLVSGRGFCSGRPRYDLQQRYLRSGKDKLILLIVSDLDPAGMSIAESFARSMRDDFGVEKVHAIKVAITHEQVQAYGLPHGEKAKADDARRKAFVELFGEYVYEVEALPVGELPKLVDSAIRSVLDLDAYNAEVEQEKADAVEIKRTREQVFAAWKGAGA